jgi:hypothetical protein
MTTPAFRCAGASIRLSAKECEPLNFADVGKIWPPTW